MKPAVGARARRLRCSWSAGRPLGVNRSPPPTQPPKTLPSARPRSSAKAPALRRSCSRSRKTRTKPPPTIIMCHGWGGVAKSVAPGCRRVRTGRLPRRHFRLPGLGGERGPLCRRGRRRRASSRRALHRRGKEVREIVDPLDQTTDLHNVIHWEKYGKALYFLPVNDVEQIGRLIQRINDFADLLNLGSERLAALAPRRRLRQQDAAFTRSPAAVVEDDDKVAGPGEDDGIRPQLSPCRPSRDT